MSQLITQAGGQVDNESLIRQLQYLPQPLSRTVGSTTGPNGEVSFQTGGVDYAALQNFQVGRLRRKGREFGGTYGRRVANWSGASLQNSGGTASLVTTSDLPPKPDSATKVLRLDQNAAQSFGQQVCDTADYTPSGQTTITIGLWVKNPGTASLSCQVQLFNASAGANLQFNFTVDPCDWTFITIGNHSKAFDNFTWGTDNVHYVRVSQRDAGADAWPASSYCLFGPTYVDCRGRPRFMLSFDDTTKSVYHPAAAATGYPASGRSLRSIVEHYGFKGTLYCIPSAIGRANYLTQRELLEMQDIGWAIGSHSYSHPTGATDVAGSAANTGLRLLGPYGYALLSAPYQFTASSTGVLCTASNDDTAIYNDVIRGVTELAALGIHNADSIFALPQGAWDTYVRSAVIRSGVKFVRGISSYNNYNTIALGRPSGGGNTGPANAPGGWIHQADAVQTDGTITIANAQAYVDDCIAMGATGSNYHHNIDTTNAAVLDGLCSYLKTKSDAGLIDVMTASEVAYDDGLL